MWTASAAVIIYNGRGARGIRQERQFGMIRITRLKLNPNHTQQDLREQIIKRLKLKKQQFTYEIERQSVDGRNKPFMKYIYTVDVKISGWDSDKEKYLIQKINNNNIMYTNGVIYKFPDVKEEHLGDKVVIVGTGPAGLFCGLMLARAGLKPVIFERGSDVARRSEKVRKFWETGELDRECNVQFGEGGAGTFSDGKLNTQIKDSSGRIRKVLEIFVEFGAPKEILYLAKPHIGTDVLAKVVFNMREEICRLGGSVFFDSKVTDICVEKDEKSVIINNDERVPFDRLVLALGHSARDTFELLYSRGFSMEQKAFAVGVRVEHPQEMVDDYAYGENIYELPPASYKVTYKAQKGRGVYSFCMCPGGYVVNASSEEGRLCVNGMSYSKRDGRNANSAVVVTVTPEDYKVFGDGPLAGVAFQRDLEEKAYREGKGKIPCQTYESFKLHQECHTLGEILPCTKGAYQTADLHRVFPEELCSSIVEGMEGFSRQFPGFNRKDAVLLGVESRTSSPLRIVRNENLVSNFNDIYPCGEGAGYAGGITSAAVDGIRVAEAIVTA